MKERLTKLFRRNNAGLVFLDRKTGKISRKLRGPIEDQIVRLNPEQLQVLRKVIRRKIELDKANDVSN